MSNKLTKQHVQLPNNMTSESLTPKDLLVYVSIKRHMNNKTKEAFPSLVTLGTLTGMSKPSVINSINNLKDEGFISVRREGRKSVYKFNSYKNFEPFSYEFLDKDDLTSNEKAYILASQQYMFKDEANIGKISFTETELSEKINMSQSVINRCNNSLKEKGYITLINTKNTENGIRINEKIFHLDELGQTIVFALQNHEDRISENEKTIELMSRQIKELQDMLQMRIKIDQTITL